MSRYDITAFSLKAEGPVRNLCLNTSDGYLRFEGREVYSPTAKFAFEDAKNGVHIRCLYNNKFLVRKASSDWITVTASEPVEDESRSDCTLFNLRRISDTTIKWVHVQTGMTVAIVHPDDPENGYYLCLKTPDNDAIEAESTPIDVNSIIKLPGTLVFKGHNNNYLQSDSDGYQQSTGNDPHDKRAWFETFPVSNGDVRIKSVHTGKFWRRVDPSNWIIADSDDPSSYDSNTVFQIVKLNATTIALVNRGNNKFCKRVSGGNNENYLIVDEDSGIKEAELVVEEPVVSRSIKVEYRLKDARIYDLTPRSWLSLVASNDLDKGDIHTSLSVTYTESLAFSLNVSATVTTGFSAKVGGGVPLVASGEVTESSSISITAGFGITENKSHNFTASVDVTIPPRKKRQAKMLAIEGKSNVPFSYKQVDILADKTRKETTLDDGVFEGLNGYEFHVQVYDPDEPENIISDNTVPPQLVI